MFPSRPINRAALALTVGLLATAAPAAASPAPDPGTRHPQYPASTTFAPARVIVTTPTGFDWGDAAIGAGATLGLVLITAGSGLALTRRHTRLHPGPIAS